MSKSIGQDFINFRKTYKDDWRGLTAGSKFLIIFMTILSLPFIIESALWMVIIAVLIPVCFLFGVVKHKAPILWIFVIFIINLGGLADLGADVWLLCKIMYYVIIKSETEHFESDTERQIFLARLIITLATGLPGVFILYTAMGIETKEELAKRQAAGKRLNNGTSGGKEWAIILIIVWKVVAAVTRIVLLVKILISAIRNKKITQDVEYSIQWMEAFLSIDVLCAAIPLGILTALEIFYFTHHRGFAPGEVYELIKLIALAIDLVGLAYLFYFEIFGLDRCTGGHHEADPKLEETTPIINAQFNDDSHKFGSYLNSASPHV